jgi:Holliday junction resolvase RusA-like endonuclease
VRRELWIPVKPKVKPRPRLSRGRAYTPQAAHDHEQEIASHWAAAGFEKIGIDTAVAVDITYTLDGSFVVIEELLERPKGLPTGDTDNYSKATLDALNGVAFEDDRQVTDLAARKRTRDWCSEPR